MHLSHQLVVLATFDALAQQVQAYESSLKYYRDLKNVIDTSFEEGKLEGKLEGKCEGTRDGFDVGCEVGRLDG